MNHWSTVALNFPVWVLLTERMIANLSAISLAALAAWEEEDKLKDERKDQR